MTLNRLVVPAFALLLCTAGSGLTKASASTPAAALAQQHGGWDMPPADLPEVQHQGFRDGIDGARKDFDNHRRFNVNNRDEFRHPHVPRPEREAYREGFRRGYDVGTRHLMGDRDHDRDHDHDHY